MSEEPKVLTRMRLCECWGDNLDEKELKEVNSYIEQLQQENKELKEYKCKRDDCCGRIKENHRLTGYEILNELENWLEEELKIIYRDGGFKHKILLEVLDKLKELKGNDK